MKPRLLYRKRDRSGVSVKTTVALSPKAKEGLDLIRQAFHRRYPDASYPTFSACLELVLDRNMRELRKHPKLLAREVETFQQKYLPKEARSKP